MATSLHRRKMKEENPNTCRALITTKDLPPNSPISYFFSITIPQPKIRIKIPKLLVKTMRKRGNRDANDDHRRKKKKWAKPGKLFPKKVGSIFSNVFGNKKPPETCFSSGENGKDCGNDDGFGHLAHAKEIEILNKDESNDTGSVQNTSKSSENNLSGEDQPFAVAPQPLLSTSHLFKNILEIEDEQEKQKRHGDEKRPQQPSMAKKLPPRKSLSFSSFFNKKTGLNFIRGKVKKDNTSSASTSCNSNCYGADNGSNGSGTSAIVIGRQESSPSLPRVPSRILTTRKKLRMARSTRSKASRWIHRESEQEVGEREDRGDKELCKKRILMGERCKPLNYPGTLQYDKNGILLPEILQDY